MTTTAPEQSERRGSTLPTPAAFVLQASIVTTFLMASAAPTPLYAGYQRSWGFEPVMTTVAFGVYALGVLVSLLVTGRLSDHVGRRPVLVVAIAVQAATMIAFSLADGIGVLIATRVVQGLATGAAIAAVGAGLLDVDRTRGAIANSVAPVTGTALGALVSGVLVQFLPAPEHLVYLVLFVVFLVQAVGVALMAETSSFLPGAVASLRPRFALPRDVRRPMAAAAPALVAVWSLAGLYGSLGPVVVRQLTGSSAIVLGGIALFALAAPGAVAVLVLRDATATRAMRVGTSSLALGVATTLVGISWTSATAFFAGTVIAGFGFGAAFQGAIRTVVAQAAPHERAGVLSLAYVISYLSMGLPAIVAGVLVTAGDQVLDTSREYGAVVILLALVALASQLRPRRQTGCAAMASR